SATHIPSDRPLDRRATTGEWGLASCPRTRGLHGVSGRRVLIDSPSRVSVGPAPTPAHSIIGNSRDSFAPPSRDGCEDPRTRNGRGGAGQAAKVRSLRRAFPAKKGGGGCNPSRKGKQRKRSCCGRRRRPLRPRLCA